MPDRTSQLVTTALSGYTTYTAESTRLFSLINTPLKAAGIGKDLRAK
jgi:hypothetical protein